jgi:hypothetical protein
MMPTDQHTAFGDQKADTENNDDENSSSNINNGQVSSARDPDTQSNDRFSSFVG